jgi:hypothetical protein
MPFPHFHCNPVPAMSQSHDINWISPSWWTKKVVMEGNGDMAINDMVQCTLGFLGHACHVAES